MVHYLKILPVVAKHMFPMLKTYKLSVMQNQMVTQVAKKFCIQQIIPGFLWNQIG